MSGISQKFREQLHQYAKEIQKGAAMQRAYREAGVAKAAARPKKSGYLSGRKASNLMHRGSALVLTMREGEQEWSVMPGGRVTLETADKIINTPGVRAGKDSLFPGMDQTWRM